MRLWTPESALVRRAASVKDRWKRVFSDPLGLIGIGLTVMMMLLAFVAPWASPHDPTHQFAGSELRPPGGAYPLGTDELGRDLLSRVLHGARPSLTVAIAAVLIGGFPGVLAGLLGGYRGGWVDAVFMRVLDAVFAFPPMLVGIAIAAILGPGLTSVALAGGIASMPPFARLARAGVLAERTREYVAAAVASSATDWRIMHVHILPNITSPLFVQAATVAASAVVLEAALGFLGLGVQPPQPSWGSLLNAARPYLRDATWYALFPGIAIACTSIGLNFLSDAARNALDPRQRSRRAPRGWAGRVAAPQSQRGRPGAGAPAHPGGAGGR